MLKNLKIRNKFLILVLSINLLMLFLTFFSNYSFSKKVVIKETQQKAMKSVQGLAHTLIGYLNEKSKVAWTFSQQPKIIQWLKSNDVRNVVGTEDSVYVEIIDYFKTLVNNDGDLKSAFIASEKTQSYYEDKERPIPDEYRVGKRQWYRNTIDGGKPIFDVEVDYVDKSIGVNYRFPIYKENGDPIGVGGIDLSIEHFTSYMTELDDIFETGQALLIGDDGTILYHQDKELILSKKLQEFKDDGKLYKNMTQVTQNIIEGKQGIDPVLYDGEERYFIYVPIEELGWSLVLSVAKKEINSPLKVLASNSILIILGTSILLIGAILYATASICKPINKVANFISNCASKGATDQKLNIDSKDEVGMLAHSFNEMIESQRAKAEVASEIAHGNLEVEVNVVSDKDVLGKAINTMKKRIQSLVEDVNMLASSALDGNLNVRANVSRHEGEYNKIVQGINSTLDTMLGPINEAARVLEQVSERNLAVRMEGDYKGDHAKLKQMLNKAINHLDDSLRQLSLGAQQVSSASAQIGSTSQTVAHGASEQASSIEEMSSSLEEITAMTKQNANNAEQAKSLSDEARNSAAKGVDNMNELSSAIQRINDSANETSKIVKTIDEIAFQTNLLALNAAVEAARAGDAGKGFAVVAEEVRDLAMRSAEAAQNTASMIEESVKNSDAGVEINQKMIERLNLINEQIVKVGEVMSEISAASKQQSDGLTEINNAMGQMNQVTQQTAANSEESASTAQELASQAQEMRHMVAKFNLTENVEEIDTRAAFAKDQALLAKEKKGGTVKSKGRTDADRKDSTENAVAVQSKNKTFDNVLETF